MRIAEQLAEALTKNGLSESTAPATVTLPVPEIGGSVRVSVDLGDLETPGHDVEVQFTSGHPLNFHGVRRSSKMDDSTAKVFAGFVAKAVQKAVADAMDKVAEQYLRSRI